MVEKDNQPRLTWGFVLLNLGNQPQRLMFLMEGEGMINESVWVIGFNKETGLREKFVCCPKNNSKFYQELYIGEGYNVKILTDEEVSKLIEAENDK